MADKMDSVDKSEGGENSVRAIESETAVTSDVDIDKTEVAEDSHETEISPSSVVETELQCDRSDNEENSIAEKCDENEKSEGTQPIKCELDKETTDSMNTSEDSSHLDDLADSITDLKTEADAVKALRKYELELSNTVSNIIQEGKAYIIRESENVFYNPVQEFNRDLSVLAISVFSEEHKNDPRCRLRGTKRKTSSIEGYNDSSIGSDEDTVHPREPGIKYDDGIVILEALSATGLRSIRYAKEVSGVKAIVANDISKIAVENIKKNIEYNSVMELVTTSQNDASLLMYMRKAQGNFFDVVDLDPYGCPSRFLDSAVQCVRDGGLLLITCTDMAVLAGNSPETCYIKYGAISLRNPACHEMALRIALQCIESHANRYGRYIVPQLSFSADFYIRVIVKVYTSPAMCKKTTSKLVMMYQCVGCQSPNYWPLGLMESCNKNNVKYHLCRGPPVSQECPHCDSSYYQGGPIWSGQLHNITFVEKMLSRIDEKDFVTEKRMEGMLELIKEELVGTLLYHTIDSLCSKVHCEVIPRNKFVSAILHAGYKVSLSHAAPNSVKTNAPSGVIWDIIRCWVQEHPVNPKRLNQGSVAEKLLSAVPRVQANFDLHPEAIPRNKKKLLRYQQNPLPFWGPGTRDKIHCDSQSKMSKSYVNQNKKHKRSNIDKGKAEMKAVINSKNIDIIEVVTLTDDDDDDGGGDYIKQEIKIEKSDSTDRLENNENHVGDGEGTTEKSDDIKNCDSVTEVKEVEENVNSPLGKSVSDPSDVETKVPLENKENVTLTSDKVNEEVSLNNDCPDDNKSCEKGQVSEESETV